MVEFYTRQAYTTSNHSLVERATVAYGRHEVETVDWKYMACVAAVAVVFLLPMILRYLRDSWRNRLTAEEQAIYDAAVRDADNDYEGFGDFYNKPCLPAAELLRAARGHPSPETVAHLTVSECSCSYVICMMKRRLEKQPDSGYDQSAVSTLTTT